MNNNLNSLNNYLFEELERLNDDETLEQDNNFENEIKRARAISDIGRTIVGNAALVLNAKKYADEIGLEDSNNLLQLRDVDSSD